MKFLVENTKSSDIMNRNYSATMGKSIGIISGKELVLEDGIILGDGITYLSRDYEVLGGEYINRIEKKNQREKFKEANVGNKIILRNAPKGAKYVFKNFDKEVIDEITQRLKQENKKQEIELIFEGKLGERPVLKGKIAKYVFKNFDKEVIDEITQRLKQENKKQEIELIFEGKLGERPVLKGKITNNYGKEIVEIIVGENIIEQASKKSAEAKSIEEKLCETGDTPFVVTDCKVYIDNNIFMPVLSLFLKENLEKNQF